MSQFRMPIHLSFAEGLSNQIDGVLSRCILDFKAMLLDEAIATVGDCLRMTAHGTKHLVVGFELDAEAFDLKLRAALRARGLNLSDRNLAHIESSVECMEAFSVADTGEASNGSGGPGAAQ